MNRIEERMKKQAQINDVDSQYIEQYIKEKLKGKNSELVDAVIDHIVYNGNGEVNEILNILNHFQIKLNNLIDDEVKDYYNSDSYQSSDHYQNN